MIYGRQQSKARSLLGLAYHVLDVKEFGLFQDSIVPGLQTPATLWWPKCICCATLANMVFFFHVSCPSQDGLRISHLYICIFHNECINSQQCAVYPKSLAKRCHFL